MQGVSSSFQWQKKSSSPVGKLLELEGEGRAANITDALS
jgi:hypothetical protein